MENENDKLVRLRLITHNARLVDSRKAAGFTAEVAAKETGISRSRLQNIENLKAVPTVDEMCKLAVLLNQPIDNIFPEEILSAVEAGVFARRLAYLNKPTIISLTEAEERGLLGSDGGAGVEAIDKELDRGLLSKSLSEVMATLTPRERRVITKRFGLDGEGSHTLEEIGETLKVGKARIQQIEAKALRRLRNPSRSRKLEAFLEY